MHDIQKEFADIPLVQWYCSSIPGETKVVFLMNDGEFCYSEVTPGEPWPFNHAAMWLFRETRGRSALGWLPRNYRTNAMPHTVGAFSTIGSLADLPEIEEPIMRHTAGEDTCRLNIQHDNNGDVYFSLYARDSEHGDSFIDASNSLKHSHFDDHDLYEYGVYLKARARKDGLL